MENNKRNAQNAGESKYSPSDKVDAVRSSYNSRVDSSDKARSGASNKKSSHASDYSPNANNTGSNRADNRTSGSGAR